MVSSLSLRLSNLAQRALRRLLPGRLSYRFAIRNLAGLADFGAAVTVANAMRMYQLLDPLESSGPGAGAKLLIIAPHPDDEVIGPGGTLIRAISNGAHATVVYLTSGSAHQAAIREAEATAVAQRIGFGCEFLRWEAGRIPVDTVAVDRLADVLAAVRPDILMLPFLLDDHDDHRRASELLMNVARQQKLPSEFEVWAYQVYSAVVPNVVVDITRQEAEKSAAIRMYISQMESRDWANFSSGLSAWTSRLLKGRKQAAYAEAFFVVPAMEYVALAEVYFVNGVKGAYVRHYRDPR